MARIIAYIHSLAGGGAERVWAVIASGLAQRGHEVLFVVERNDLENAQYLQDVDLYGLRGSTHLAQIIDLMRTWRRFDADLVISAASNANVKATIAKLFMRRSLIASVHSEAADPPRLLGKAGFVLLPFIERVADRLVYNSQGLKKRLEARSKILRKRGVVIHNPVWLPAKSDFNPADVDEQIPALAGKQMILSVGRLIDATKGQSDLLRAFAGFAKGHPEFHLVFLGEGPSATELSSLAVKLGVAQKVHFPGYRRDPWSFYARAAIFAHTARHEAFGNVIVEALAFGLPVVSTDCLGPKEILGKEIGWVVARGNLRAIEIALSEAATKPVNRDALRARAAEFGSEFAVTAYEALIETVINEKRSRRNRKRSIS
jgi:glycosyltransferase involved in cell wall biosynthesis